jgi:hypothetical protein
MALYNTRRNEEKRKAKRAANLKWSTMSKAKEKALFDDMMKANERLRHRAMILKKLPDAVSDLSEPYLTYLAF